MVNCIALCTDAFQRFAGVSDPGPAPGLSYVEAEIPCTIAVGRQLLAGDEAWLGSNQVRNAVDDGRAGQLDGCRAIDDDLGRGLALDGPDILIELAGRVDFADALAFD